MTDPALIDLRRSPRLEQIMADIAAESGFTTLELLSPRRLKPLAAARHKAFYRACTETALSLPQIGRAFNRDHTTILYGRDKHAAALANTCPAFGITCNVSVETAASLETLMAEAKEAMMRDLDDKICAELLSKPKPVV